MNLNSGESPSRSDRARSPLRRRHLPQIPRISPSTAPPSRAPFRRLLRGLASPASRPHFQRFTPRPSWQMGCLLRGSSRGYTASHTDAAAPDLRRPRRLHRDLASPSATIASHLLRSSPAEQHPHGNMDPTKTACAAVKFTHGITTPFMCLTPGHKAHCTRGILSDWSNDAAHQDCPGPRRIRRYPGSTARFGQCAPPSASRRFRQVCYVRWQPDQREDICRHQKPRARCGRGEETVGYGAGHCR